MNTLYLKPVGGLANRIRVINSGYAFALNNNLEMAVIWEMNADLNATFSRLFEPLQDIRVYNLKPGINLNGIKLSYFPDKHPEGWRSMLFKNLNHSILEDGIVWYDEISARFKDLAEDCKPEKLKNQASISHMGIKKCEPLFEAILRSQGNKYISTSWNIVDVETLQVKLRPKAVFQKKIDSLQIKRENTVGVHIRRTDHTWSIEHSGNDKFVALMKIAIDSDPNTKFFLASDDDQTIKEMETHFPNRIIRFHHNSKDRNNPSGIDSAILDLFALASCNRIIGSYLSTFSDLAASIGNINVSYAT